MRARADGLPDSAEARAAASTSGQLGTLRPASYFRFGLHAKVSTDHAAFPECDSAHGRRLADCGIRRLSTKNGERAQR